jgi:hypothetical protein
MSDMADAELLQAARDTQQPAPAPALDAAILNAASQRAAEVRKARTIAAEAPAAIPKTPKTRSLLERFSGWLFGDGETRGHLWQTAAVGVFMGVALGFILQANRETAPAFPEMAMMTRPPASPAIMQGETPKEEPARRAMPPAEEKPAEVPEAARAIVSEAQARAEAQAERQQQRAAASPVRSPEAADAIAAEARARTEAQYQRAAASPASPPPEAARRQDRAVEAEPLSVTAPIAAPPSRQPMARAAEERADRYSGIAAAPAAPSPARNAGRSDLAGEEETEIDAQLKHILDLRRAGKEEEAQRLLRELRARYPDIDIDERLRQREKEESEEGKK